jgi:hypothetical protein
VSIASIQITQSFANATKYVTSYHTGAGLGDVTFDRNSSIATTGFLNATNTSTPEAPNNFQEFDLGTEFPW